MLVSAQCQPRHTVCIGTLPLTGDQAAVAVTPSPRHSLSTRYLEAERPVSTLCGAGAPLRTSQWRKPSRRVPVCSVMQGPCPHPTAGAGAAECVGAGTSQPVTHPGLGWAGLGWAGLGWAGTRPQMLIGAQIWACHLVTLGQVTPPPHVPTCHQSNYHTFM